MKKIIFCLLAYASVLDAKANCASTPLMNEEGVYEGCNITSNGKTSMKMIAESACTNYCQLQTVNSMAEGLSGGKAAATGLGINVPAEGVSSTPTKQLDEAAGE
ncbi:MAG TPA: hypothetical protein VIH99_08720 [Bdellovibrionota bacterium]